MDNGRFPWGRRYSRHGGGLGTGFNRSPAPAMNAPPRFVLVASTVALLVAVLHMPYGYYQLVRLGICGVAGWSAWSLWNDGRRRLATVFAICALTYNPVFLVHFQRETWQAINVASAALFALVAWLMRPEPPAKDITIDVPRRGRDRIE